MTGDQGAFADLLAANETYAEDFRLAGLEPRARKGLAVVTCIDSRIEPLGMLGLRPGDAKILRNAGARVTDDVLRSLALAAHLLGVDRVMIIGHTKCRMSEGTEDEVREAMHEASGLDTSGLDFLVIDDLQATIRADVERVRLWPYLSHVDVAGFVYDIDSGRLTAL